MFFKQQRILKEGLCKHSRENSSHYRNKSKLHNVGNPDRKELIIMPQIIACEWRVIFSENLLHKTVYPLKDPWQKAQNFEKVDMAYGLQCSQIWKRQPTVDGRFRLRVERWRLVLYWSAPESGVGGEEGEVCDGDGVGAGTELVRPHPAVHPAQHLYIKSHHITVQYSTVQYSTVQHLAQLVGLVLAGLVSSEHDRVHHVPHSLHMT